MFERINIDSLKNRTILFYGQKAQVVAINKDDDTVVIRSGSHLLQERKFTELIKEMASENVILLTKPLNINKNEEGNSNV
jgi:hypothetical protein